MIGDEGDDELEAIFVDVDGEIGGESSTSQVSVDAAAVNAELAAEGAATVTAAAMPASGVSVGASQTLTVTGTAASTISIATTDASALVKLDDDTNITLTGSGKVQIGNSAAVLIADYNAVKTAVGALKGQVTATTAGTQADPWTKTLSAGSSPVTLVTFAATGTTVSATVVNAGETDVTSIDTATLGTVNAVASGGTVADGTLATSITITAGDCSETVYVTFTLN